MPMKLLIPQRICAAIEPTIRAVAADATIVPLDDDGTPGADPIGAEVLLRWWTPVSVMRRSLPLTSQPASAFKKVGASN